MTFLRTDKEVALNDLLIASEETIDHYRDAAEFLEDANIVHAFKAIVLQRESFIAGLTKAVRALGDLPSMPDPDKETGVKLMHRAGAFLSENHVAEILRQRIESELQLTDFVEAGREAGLDGSCSTLLDEMAEHVAQTIAQLKDLLAQNPA